MQVKAKKRVSWKTTGCGIATALGTALAQSDIPILQVIGQILTPLGAVCTGFFARDYDKTSEDVKGY